MGQQRLDFAYPFTFGTPVPQEGCLSVTVPFDPAFGMAGPFLGLVILRSGNVDQYRLAMSVTPHLLCAYACLTHGDGEGLFLRGHLRSLHGPTAECPLLKLPHHLSHLLHLGTATHMIVESSFHVDPWGSSAYLRHRTDPRILQRNRLREVQPTYRNTTCTLSTSQDIDSERYDTSAPSTQRQSCHIQEYRMYALHFATSVSISSANANSNGVRSYQTTISFL